MWEIEANSTATSKDILWVFQTKIIALQIEAQMKADTNSFR